VYAALVKIRDRFSIDTRVQTRQQNGRQKRDALNDAGQQVDSRTFSEAARRSALLDGVQESAASDGRRRRRRRRRRRQPRVCTRLDLASTDKRGARLSGAARERSQALTA
jgi:hypothetical protein